MEFEHEKDTGKKFADAIKDIVRKGNITGIKIKADDITLLEMPVNAEAERGAIDKVYLPALMKIGAAAAAVSGVQDIQVIIERPDGKIEVADGIVFGSGDKDEEEKGGSDNTV